MILRRACVALLLSLCLLQIAATGAQGPTKLPLAAPAGAAETTLASEHALYPEEEPRQGRDSRPGYGEYDAHHMPYYAEADAPSDPAGQTYYLSGVRRTLTRPAGTTLAQLAASMPPTPTRRASPGRRAGDGSRLVDEAPREVVTELARRWRRHRARHAPNDKASSNLPADAHARRPTRDEALAQAAPSEARPQGQGDFHHGHHQHKQPTNPHVDLSWRGLNSFEQRYANGGNQLPFDPPDQGLCVGNGFVLETVNGVLRVYDASTGNALVATLDSNTFYGFPAFYNSTTETVGPVLVDPSCVYDHASRRWFHTLWSTMEDGATFVDVAVSDSADPTGSWAYYRVPGSNNGDDGTPNVGCAGGVCLPDFPQMAVWEHALVITVNEFDSIEPYNFYGANVYAVDKAALLRGSQAANTALVRTGTGDINALQPARQSGPCSTPNTYLVATNSDRDSTWVSTLQLLSLRGTETLAHQGARVTLEWVQRGVRTDVTYTAPPLAEQKPGVNPLGIVEYDTDTPYVINTLDARMTSVGFAHDKLYCVWGTALLGHSKVVAGVAWVVVDPHAPTRALRSGLLRAPGDNHAVMPYMAVRSDGLGVVAVSVLGPDYYPSPAFAVLSKEGMGPLQLVVEGAGVLDSLSGYVTPAGRFGDYGAAALDEHGAFWVASEYVAQTCTAEQLVEDSTCSNARNYYANWATRITKITLHW